MLRRARAHPVYAFAHLSPRRGHHRWALHPRAHRGNEVFPLAIGVQVARTRHTARARQALPQPRKAARFPQPVRTVFLGGLEWKGENGVRGFVV
jgi:hypothetical protein